MKKLLIIVLLVFGCEDSSVNSIQKPYPFIDNIDFQSVQLFDMTENPNFEMNGKNSLSYCNGDKISSPRDPASFVSLLKLDSSVVFYGNDSSLVAFDMTLSHPDYFSIQLTDRAMVADYRTDENQTKLVIVSPETGHLFEYNGDFTLSTVIAGGIIENESCYSEELLNDECTYAAQLNVIIDEPRLTYAYPNAFNENTNFDIILYQTHLVQIYIVDEQYELIETIINDNLGAGIHSFNWDASDYESGYYRVIADFGENECYVNLHYTN